MRILGIDLGSKSIKAVEIDSAFGRYEIRDYHETPVEPDEEPSRALARLVQSVPRRLDRVVMGLKTGVVTFRNFELPAKNKKALMAAIGFELEDELPFPMDQSSYDYSVIGQSKQLSRVHVAATLQRNVVTQLHLCQSAEVDPDLLTTETWSYRTLFNRTLPQQDAAPILLIQMGHERTTIYCHAHGQPIMARDVLWGGRDLTAAICKKYGIALDKAEQTKIDSGFILPESQRSAATQEQIEFSDTLLEPMQLLLRELKQALLTVKNLAHQQVGTVYVAGGTSLLPGLAQFLQEHLETAVKPLQALSSVSTAGVTYSEQTDANFALAVSLALCMVGSDRSTSINFRRGEFAKAGRAREFDTQAIRRVLMATGAVLLAFFTSLFVQSFYYKDRLADTNGQLEKNIKMFFGSVSSNGMRTYMASTQTLKKDVNKELDKQRDLFKLLGPNPHSPIDFLKELSMQVPRDVVVDMIQFQAGAAPTAPFSPTSETDATLSFLVSNPQTGEKLTSLFASKLPGLQRGKMEEVPGTEAEGKQWKITFSGKLREDAYGK